RRKGVDGFSVETAGLLRDPVPISRSSDSLTDDSAPTVHQLCRNQAFCGLYDAQFLCLLTVQQQFSRAMIRRNHGTGGHIVLDAYTSRLITLLPPEYGAPCETLLPVHLFHPAINL
ncbi:hypothetical protein AVEN_80995-1, partial [Araneus ventricosus]